MQSQVSMMAILELSRLTVVEILMQTLLMVTCSEPVSTSKTIQSLVPMLCGMLLTLYTIANHATRTSMVATMVILSAKVPALMILTVQPQQVTTMDLNFTGKLIHQPPQVLKLGYINQSTHSLFLVTEDMEAETTTV